MKTGYVASSLLLAGLLAVGSPAAMADDDLLAGALFGAGAGAILGHAANGGDGAVVGGFLGAIIGAALADDDDHGRRVVVRHQPRPVYAPPVVRYYEPPKPYWNRSWHRDWRNDRHDRRGDRDDWRDHDRSRGGDGPRDYRNW